MHAVVSFVLLSSGLSYLLYNCYAHKQEPDGSLLPLFMARIMYLNSKILVHYEFFMTKKIKSSRILGGCSFFFLEGTFNSL